MISDNLNTSIDVKEKVFNFHKQIAKQKRKEIISKQRQQFIKANTHLPLRSHVLQKYASIPEAKLHLYRDQIFETLDQIDGQSLSEEQSLDLSHDLLHLLMHDDQFLIPYTFKFLKDESYLTATVVSFVYDCIDVQQANYWLKYMREDSKNGLYLNIQCEEDVSKTLQDDLLLETLIDDWGYLLEAQGAIAYLLRQIEINTETEFVKSVFDKLHKMNQEHSLNVFSSSFFNLVARLMIHYQQEHKIFAYLTTILNESLHKLYTENNLFQLDENVLFSIDILLQRNKDYCKVIFTHENFQFLLKMILNYYLRRYVHSEIVIMGGKLLSEQRIKKVKLNFINRLIDICTNHLRMNMLYKNPVQIESSLIQTFRPQIFQANAQKKYQNLLNLNNLYKKSKQSQQLQM